MKLTKLFYALGIGCTLCACSSTDEPQAQNEQDFTKSNKYVTVSIVTTGGDGTRAAEDYYDDGLETEYDVNSVGFYFFNRQGDCVDAEYYTSTEFKKDDRKPNVDPAVTEIGTIEIELSGNRVYDSVIAVLNPNSDLMQGDKLKAQSKGQLINYFANYSGAEMSGSKGNFTMSNSVYIDDASYSGSGLFTPHTATSIGAENIYTKAKPESEMTPEEKTALNQTREEKAINIYVERVCAKVIVEKQPTFKSYFVSKDEKTNETTTEISVMVNEDGKSVEKKMIVVPEFKGIGMSVLAKNALLIKDLDTDLSYKFNSDITGFQWNDAANKRSFWESSIKLNAEGGGFNYTAWDNLKNVWSGASTANYIEYINPNTLAPTDYDANTNEATNTTKLLVRAQLKYKFKDSDTATPLDLVMFGGSYWMADYLLYHAAERVSKHLEHIEDFLTEKNLTADELTSIKDEIKEVTTDNIKSKLSLVRLTTGTVNAYLAKLSITDADGNYPDLLSGITDATLKGKVAGVINTQVQQILDDITNRQIQYWKDGQTYFYIPIRHQGFSGLNNGSYLNGVVRNHVYQVTINQIWGLGTPVIEPKDPIDPERPDNAPNSYMTAKIHVLKWRVVNSTVTMH